MIVLSNSTEQTLSPGQSLTFDLTKLHTGCAECHRAGTGSVKLRCNGVYEVYFGGNIGGTASGLVQLVIELGGDPLLETTMKSIVSAPGDFNSVSRGTYVKNCCGDYDRITVTNNGNSTVVVDANAVLKIGRRSG